MGHENRVHQKCFEKSIDKAIRVRSTRSASFENIARSATHSWKTQKCSQVRVCHVFLRARLVLHGAGLLAC